MLSYQHAFHAGNHADLIKHIILVGLLERLLRKNKPFSFIDTHAGNGIYQLTHHKQDEIASKKLLDLPGFDGLSKSEDGELYSKVYTEIISPYIMRGEYPGSPLIVDEAIAFFSQKRKLTLTHNLHLSELHPSSFKALKQVMKQGQFQVHNRNGFELLRAIAPPKPNRGLVLIDPPYEQAQEYSEVVDACRKACRLWPQGIFAIWYPLLSPSRKQKDSGYIEDNPKHGMSEKMIAAFAEFIDHGLLNIQYIHQAPSSELGMYGSGVLIINPPYEFDKDITKDLGILRQFIQQDDNHLSRIEYLVAPK